jgi:RecJ-like exonuclease
LYFFVINACKETGYGAAGGLGVVVEVGVGAVVAVAGGVDMREADGVVGIEEVALGAGAGGAASSVLQATTAVITNATTPAHATRRSMWSSLPSHLPEPVESSRND